MHGKKSHIRTGAGNMQKHQNDFCEPTSSTVKVEDLVTDSPESPAQLSIFTGPQRFWDKPTPPPDLDWHYDPRMPEEWNIMVNSVNTYRYGTYKNPSSSAPLEQYTSARPEDISKAAEFTRKWYPDARRREQLMKMNPVWLSTPDESELSLSKLRTDLTHRDKKMQ